MNFMDFGRQNNNCFATNEGFVIWKITGKENNIPLLIGEGGMRFFVHILVLSGEIKAECENKPYLLTRNCFADFSESRSLQIHEISEHTQAYVLFFTASLIATLMKKTPPFPLSYVLGMKACPITMMSQNAIKAIQKRIESIVDIFGNESHHFFAEIMSNTLRIYTMDIANEFICQENEKEETMEAGRKHILFKQFVGLLLAHVRKEHSASWYASKLCVTPQYLNRAIKSISQKTVSEHISIVLIGSIIEQLENTEEPISQIAADFCFPDLATLTKFFKRHTGKSPTEYRKSARA